jgi:hypothetical protein
MHFHCGKTRIGVLPSCVLKQYLNPMNHVKSKNFVRAISQLRALKAFGFAVKALLASF